MVIKKVKSIVFLASLISMFCLVGCEFAFPPHIANGYNSDISFQVDYTNGKFHEKVKIPYGRILSEGEKNFKVKSIKVFDKDGKFLTEYVEKYLDNLRQNTKYEDEFWVITEKALYLIPQTHQKGKDWLEYVKSLKQATEKNTE